jgi:hypothetical protein
MPLVCSGVLLIPYIWEIFKIIPYDIRQVERLEGPCERLEEVSLTTIAKQLK